MAARSPLGSNPDGAWAEVNGIRLYHEVYGAGPPVVLLHGNGGSMGQFESQVDALAERFQVIGVDSRAQGKSTGHPSTLGYRQLARDVEALLERLGSAPAHVLGWSDGGIVALLLALQAPRLVRSLAITGANLRTDTTAFDPPMIDALRAVVDNPATPAWDRALNRMMLFEPDLADADLAPIACPVLVMAGDHDLIRVEHTVAIYRALPNAELAIFPGADHGYFVPQAARFNEMVVEFFAKN